MAQRGKPNLMSKISGVILSITALSLFPFSAHCARAQDVKAVIAKTNAVYKNAKTLQATYETHITAGPQGSATTKISAKVINGKKTRIDIQPDGKGVGAMGKSRGSISLLIVDNGVTAYMYLTAKNQYGKQPHNPSIFQDVMGGNGMPYGGMDASKQYKLLAPTSLDGSKVYVLEFTPEQPPVASGAPENSTIIDIYIDQATYRIKQSKVTRKSGKMTGMMTTTVKSETLDSPIPDSVFTFTPPKGAKEITLQTRPQGGGGGVGGAPRQ
jgi:outer membrane lipoprotein-sorting protein